jgi:hypothetical protein
MDFMAAQSTSNPSVEEVIGILTKQMEAGAATGGMRLNDEARTYLNVYRNSIKQRLTEWQAEGERVRNAARQLGVIAAAIASLHRENNVTDSHLSAASDVVEKHCLVGYVPEGQWCNRDR